MCPYEYLLLTLNTFNAPVYCLAANFNSIYLLFDSSFCNSWQGLLLGKVANV